MRMRRRLVTLLQAPLELIFVAGQHADLVARLLVAGFQLGHFRQQPPV